MRNKLWTGLGLLFFLFSSSLEAQVNWITSFEEAKEIATRENKFIVVDVSASWCGPCRKMALEVHTDPAFISFTENNVFMLVDEDKDTVGRILKQQFDINSYPTILILDSNGEEIDRLNGGRNTEGLIEDLQSIFDNPIPSMDLFRLADESMDDFELQKSAGTRAFDRSDSRKAEEYLSRAARLSSQSDLSTQVTLYQMLIRCQFKEEHFKECLESFDKLTAVYPGAVDFEHLNLTKASSYIALEKFKEADALMNDLLNSQDPEIKSEAREILQKFPEEFRQDIVTIEKQIREAGKLAEKNKLAEAELLINKSLESTPDNPDALLLSARIQLLMANQAPGTAENNTRKESALRQIRLAKCLAPENVEIYNKAKDLRQLYTDGYQEPRNTKAAKEFKKGEDNLEKGNDKDAVAHYLKVMDLEPDFSYTYLRMGDCFLKTNQLEQALQLYQKAIVLSRNDPEGYRFAAEVFARQNQSEKCREYLLGSLRADPSYPPIWKFMDRNAGYGKNGFERHYMVVPARLLLCRNEDDYESLLEDIPSRTLPAWRAYINHKLNFKNQNQKPGGSSRNSAKEEIDSLRELVATWNALKLQDRDLKDVNLDFIRQVSIDGHLDTFVYLELYTESYRSEFEIWKKTNGDKTNEYLENYIFALPLRHLEMDMNSSAIKAYNEGTNLFSTDPSVAITSYQKALWQDPYMVSAMHNLSILLTNSDQLEEAGKVAERWLQVSPESLNAVNQLSYIYIKMEEFEKAVTLIEEALSKELKATENDAYLLENMEQNLEFCKQKLQ